ncbi:MAG TPA: ATPase, T2SS/T4P/T4SS family [Caldisericia bacterium]|nr:ATPase, T2SS/T4P/T4SS family [Caldisericia bacterium]HRT36931.1 ATPase, T2SS/T4P/T4SS family [Caldisericia bacterium]HRU73515.1 ATPase, T2SS/T4P/T4SS family [Caldisericia bacterium]
MDKYKQTGSDLITDGIVTEEQLKIALEEQKKSGLTLLETLKKLKFINDETFANLLARQWGFPYIDLSTVEIDKDIVRLISEEIARRYQAIPFGKTRDDKIMVAISDPTDIVAIDYLRTLIPNSKLYVSSYEAIFRNIEKYYSMETTVKEAVKEMTGGSSIEVEKEETKDIELSIDEAKSLAEAAPIIRLMNQIMTEAITSNASDIHIEPQKRYLRIRYRIDGVLRDTMNLPKNIQPGVISRVKIMANLDIAERRRPQDGRINLKFRGREIDLRVSVLPGIFGEKVVLRILDKERSLIPLEQLGFSEESLEIFRTLINQPYGMILITGPTGSGKSTTLYAILRILNSPDVNILTVEDPVEYQLDGITQVQVNPKINLTFANALRSFLRQDPDIILVGEIRDKETAQIAMEAALTGHLVFSTLHTNDSFSAPTRLIDMGIEPYLIASSVIGVTAQRLVRKICADCKEEYKPSEFLLKQVGIENYDGVFYRGKGCIACNNSGYKGRIAVQEILKIDDSIREMVLNRNPSTNIKEHAIKNGSISLLQDAIDKAKKGITTIDEVIRVISTVEVLEG